MSSAARCGHLFAARGRQPWCSRPEEARTRRSGASWSPRCESRRVRRDDRSRNGPAHSRGRPRRRQPRWLLRRRPNQAPPRDVQTAVPCSRAGSAGAGKGDDSGHRGVTLQRSRGSGRSISQPRRRPSTSPRSARGSRRLRRLRRFRQAHRDFVAASSHRRAVFAEGSGHHIMRDRPEVALDAIAEVIAAVRAATIGVIWPPATMARDLVTRWRKTLVCPSVRE